MTREQLAEGERQHGTKEQCRTDGDHRPVYFSIHERCVRTTDLNPILSEQRFPALADQMGRGTRIRVREVAGAHPAVTSRRGPYAAHVASAERSCQSTGCGCCCDRISTLRRHEGQSVTGFHLDQSRPRYGRRGENVPNGDLFIANVQRRTPQPHPGQPGGQGDQRQVFAASGGPRDDDRGDCANTEQPDRRGKSAIETRVEHAPIVAGGDR